MNKLKEYIDKGDRYKKPKRHFENDILEVRIYCEHRKCKTYIKGKEGYNGGFVAETGQFMDLRNQCFVCKEHSHLYEHLQTHKLESKVCSLNISDFINCEFWRKETKGCTHCDNYIKK